MPVLDQDQGEGGTAFTPVLTETSIKNDLNGENNNDDDSDSDFEYLNN